MHIDHYYFLFTFVSSFLEMNTKFKSSRSHAMTPIIKVPHRSCKRIDMIIKLLN